MNNDNDSNYRSNVVNNLVKDIIGITILTIFIVGLFAPLLSPLFEEELQKKFIEHDDYKERAREAMKPINRVLWIICAISWFIVILGYMTYGKI